MFISFRFSLFIPCLAFSLVLLGCGNPEPTPPAGEQQEEPSETPVPIVFTPQEPEIQPTEVPTDFIVTDPTGTPTEPPLPTETAAPSPTSLTVNVTGEVCFPDGEIPSMTAYFEATDSELLVELPIAAGQDRYNLKLPDGIYIAYAWLPDFSRGGLYSRAVPCGLNAECEDHTVLAFSVSEETVSEGIDICDWFAGPFNVPYPPGVEQEQLTGAISGNLAYIQEEIPVLRVVAFNLSTNYWYWSSTLEGQTSYTIGDLPPGNYHVVGYDDQGRAGGHANADHELIPVAVRPGETTGEVNVTDWEAPEGSFPPDPTR